MAGKQLEIFNPVPEDGRRLHEILRDAREEIELRVASLSDELLTYTHDEKVQEEIQESIALNRALIETLTKAQNVALRLDPYVCEHCLRDGESISPHKPDCPRYDNEKDI